MTPYALLVQACGLSHREAAELHGVRIDTVKSWSAGRNRAPEGVLAELRALYAAIEAAAAQMCARLAGAPAGIAIEIGYPADDAEARALGCSCVGAWRAMAAILVARLDRPVSRSDRARQDTSKSPRGAKSAQPSRRLNYNAARLFS